MSQSKISPSSPRKILLKMSGSISAYKACEVISMWVQAGHQVQVVMTKDALQFVGTATIEGLTGKSVRTDLYEQGKMMEHIHLAKWADIVVVYPATANTINRLANGLADDLLGALFLAHDFAKPYLLAPAMNSRMLSHPSVEESLARLRGWGVRVLESGFGSLACGEVGAGRLIEPEIMNHWMLRYSSLQPLEVPKKILITYGGTFEAIDAVRGLTNVSSGQTGSILSESFFHMGWEVSQIRSSRGAKSRIPGQAFEFTSSKELKDLLKLALENDHFDAVIHLAAVADFLPDVPEETSMQKLSSSKELNLKFKKAEKILPEIKKWSNNTQVQVVAFKMSVDSAQNHSLESEDFANALHSLFAQGSADFVVHNVYDPLHPFTDSSHPYRILANKTLTVATGETTQEMATSIAELLLQNQQKNLIAHQSQRPNIEVEKDFV